MSMFLGKNLLLAGFNIKWEKDGGQGKFSY